jgi:molybdopterin converting factor small subunit
VPTPDGAITVSEETPNVGSLLDRLSTAYPQLKRALDAEDSLVNVAINEEMFVEGIRNLPLKDGDRVELVQAFSGG